MSEQWLGLHNPQRHEANGATATCVIETSNPVMARWCTRDHPCRCCMATESRILRERSDRQAETIRRIREEARALRAQVQAVRELLADHRAALWASVLVVDVNAALDGGDA